MLHEAPKAVNARSFLGPLKAPENKAGEVFTARGSHIIFSTGQGSTPSSSSGRIKESIRFWKPSFDPYPQETVTDSLKTREIHAL